MPLGLLPNSFASRLPRGFRFNSRQPIQPSLPRGFRRKQPKDRSAETVDSEPIIHARRIPDPQHRVTAGYRTCLAQNVQAASGEEYLARAGADSDRHSSLTKNEFMPEAKRVGNRYRHKRAKHGECSAQVRGHRASPPQRSETRRIATTRNRPHRTSKIDTVIA